MDFFDIFYAVDIKEYFLVIGIDFGHGEVAAACFKPGIGGVVNLNVDAGNEKTMPTVVAYQGNDVLIGKRAVNANNADTYAYFKDNPQALADPTNKIRDKTKMQLVQDFIKKLIANIGTYNDTELVVSEDGVVRKLTKNEWENNVLLLIGCPTNAALWLSNDNMTAYSNIISAATGVRTVIVIPESRAALVEARERMLAIRNNENNDNRNNRTGVLIIDFGSSTADITYLDTLSPTKSALEFSWNLGASQIEINIIKLLLENNGYSFTDLSSPLEKCAVIARAQKEDYFATGSVCFTQLLNNKAVISAYAKKDDASEFMDTVCGIGKIVNDSMKFTISTSKPGESKTGTWYELCKEFLDTAKRRLGDRLENCGLIVLAGGASRMDFLFPLCEDVFPGIMITGGGHDNTAGNPSYGVSRGMCEIVRKDIQTLGMLDEFKKDFFDNVVFNEPLTLMCDAIARGMAPVLYSISVEAIKAWNDAEHIIYTIFGAQKKIAKALVESDALSNVGLMEQINVKHNIWKINCEKALRFKVNQVFAKIYGVENDRAVIEIASSAWEAAIEKLEINGNDIVPDVSQGVAASVSIIIGKILGGVVGAIIGTLVFIVDETVTVEDLREYVSDVSNSIGKIAPVGAKQRTLIVTEFSDKKKAPQIIATMKKNLSSCLYCGLKYDVNKDKFCAELVPSIEDAIASMTYSFDAVETLEADE